MQMMVQRMRISPAEGCSGKRRESKIPYPPLLEHGEKTECGNVFFEAMRLFCCPLKFLNAP